MGSVGHVVNPNGGPYRHGHTRVGHADRAPVSGKMGAMPLPIWHRRWPRCWPSSPTRSRRARLALRTEVGRLSLHRVPRRRLASSWPAATSVRSPATSPSCSARCCATLPQRCVVDGEIVVPATDDRGLDFDALLQRIHPAESRVRRLAAETPASFVAFDLLALGDDSLLAEPLSARHSLLVEHAGDAAATRSTCARPPPMPPSPSGGSPSSRVRGSTG